MKALVKFEWTTDEGEPREFVRLVENDAFAFCVSFTPALNPVFGFMDALQFSDPFTSSLSIKHGHSLALVKSLALFLSLGQEPRWGHVSLLHLLVHCRKSS